jgi:hypothetical protein
MEIYLPVENIILYFQESKIKESIPGEDREFVPADRGINCNIKYLLGILLKDTHHPRSRNV